ncbi:hypothetical protein P261_02068 [Lachnospiraceae bacterium TWA4]|nr:hypothetical protein P261_02068 [Lachnospiraceae bacterium TWA4]
MPRAITLSDEELLDILREKAKELNGRAPIRSEIESRYQVIIKNRFGPWNNAIRKAGLVPSTGPKSEKKEDYLSPNELMKKMPKPYEEYSDAELLDIIIKKKNDLGRPPKTKELKLEERLFLSMRFGSISKAYVKAGTSIGNRPVSKNRKKNK